MISLMEPRNDMGKATCKMERKGELLNEKKIAKLVNDYVAFRKKYVQHFKYDAKAKSTNFGES